MLHNIDIMPSQKTRLDRAFSRASTGLARIIASLISPPFSESAGQVSGENIAQFFSAAV
jgi:hypothetical protein